MCEDAVKLVQRTVFKNQPSFAFCIVFNEHFCTEFFRQLILQGKDVRHVAIKSVRPLGGSIGRVYQMDRHTNAVTGSTDATTEDVFDLELLVDRLIVVVSASKLARGMPGDDS